MFHVLREYCKAVTPIVVAIATLGGCGCSTATPNQSAEVQVQSLLPALRVTFESHREGRDAPYDVRRFAFVSTPPHEWPYGTGFAVVDRRSGEVLWVYLHSGDYAPHDIRWADFDGDGRNDVFFHAGSEDVFTTYVYVNRVASKRYGLSHFALAYANEDVYAFVVDFDADGRPELIAPEAHPSEDDPCVATFQALTASMSSWKEEYRHLAGRFDTFNFYSGASPAENEVLELFSKVTITGVGRDADPSAVLRHLRVRRNLITSSLTALAPPCRARAEEINEYLSDLIQQYDGSSD